MALSNEDIKAITDLLQPINDRLDIIDNRLSTMEVKQDRMAEQLVQMQLSEKLFEMNSNKKFARLQDGMDTIEEIMKMNELIPR